MVIVVMVIIITVVGLSVGDCVIVIVVVVGLFLFAVTRRGGRCTRRLVIGALLIGFFWLDFRTRRKKVDQGKRQERGYLV